MFFPRIKSVCVCVRCEQTEIKKETKRIAARSVSFSDVVFDLEAVIFQS